MNNSIGARLAYVRKRLNLTQGEFSETTKVPLSSLKKYEGSHSEPGADALSMIATARINLHWLVTGKGEPLIKGEDASGQRGAQLPAEINVEALAAIMAAVEFANPKASPPERAAVAAHAYATSIREGLITSTRPGQRAPKNAA
jgi:transcriptional regulator with XRE-family HTH domain